MAKLSTLTDNFNDNSLNGSKWYEIEEGGATVAETTNKLVFSLPSSSGGDEYSEVGSNSTYDFEDSYVILQIVSSPSSATDAVGALELQFASAGQNVIWQVEGGILYAIRVNSGSPTTIFSTAFNPTTHAWWRIREGTVDGGSSGTIYFDTSEDGETWTNRATYAHSFNLATTSVWMNCFCYKAETNPGGFTVDNFNITFSDGAVSGTLLFGGAVQWDLIETESSITGGLIFGGTVGGELEAVLLTAGAKLYEYKIYDTEGNFLGRWNDVISEFSFSQEINRAGSAIDVVLARNSDSVVRNFDVIGTDSDESITTDDDIEIAAETATTNAIGPGTTVDLNLRVEVYVFPEDAVTPEGELIFTGYISKYVSKYGQDENTVVTLFSYGADLDNYVLEDTGDTRVTYNSMDPSDILKDALDKLNAADGIPSYDQGGTTVDDTSTTVSYTFNVNTLLEVVDKCLELAPTDWFWYYDMALNNVHFHARPVDPDHTFILGKHILELNLEKYIEDITNVVYFTGGPSPTSTDPNFFKKYTDATSITNYRRGVQRITDNRVTLEASADIIAGSLIDRAKEPRYRSSVRISSRVYDIESIKLGDLVAFRNFGNFVDDVEMQVVRIDYNPNFVQLQLDTLLPSVPKRVEDIKRNLRAEETLNNPDAPET